MISIALVNDYVTRRGIHTLLKEEMDIQVMMEAGTGPQFLNRLLCAQVKPQVAILEIPLAETDGRATMDQLHKDYPAIKIIVFSALSKEDAIIDMINRGACAFINRHADASAISNIIRNVHTDGFCLSHLVCKEYFNHANRRYKTGFKGSVHLTEREIAFIRLAASGMKYDDIANQLGRKLKTIENCRNTLFKKLSVKNRVGLVVYAYEHNLLV